MLFQLFILFFLCYFFFWIIYKFLSLFILVILKFTLSHTYAFWFLEYLPTYLLFLLIAFWNIMLPCRIIASTENLSLVFLGRQLLSDNLLFCLSFYRIFFEHRVLCSHAFFFFFHILKIWFHYLLFDHLYWEVSFLFYSCSFKISCFPFAVFKIIFQSFFFLKHLIILYLFMFSLYFSFSSVVELLAVRIEAFYSLEKFSPVMSANIPSTLFSFLYFYSSNYIYTLAFLTVFHLYLL